MTKHRIEVLVLLACCLSVSQLFSQESVPARIAILPLYANGVDTVYAQTAESILRTEIGKISTMDIISLKRTKDVLGNGICSEKECALETGKTLNATRVLGCRLSALGDKIVVQYFLVDVPSDKEMLIDQATALNVEDLEVLMKRVAKSVVNVQPINKNVEVGQVTATETQESLRRSTRNNFGIAFGYLYPQHGYNNDKRSFVFDARWDYELDDYAVGMLLGIRKGFAMNLYGSYLFSRQDICPYVGGAVGFHWVTHNPLISFGNSPTQDLRSDGIELGVHAGMRVQHTYDFQMIFNIEYIYTMNDYDDQAVVFTIGIL